MSRTALFVDFDNVYSGLRRIDEAAAERFATDPQRWLGWLADGPGGTARRFLVRRCFMNPRAYHRYRPDFVRAAFSVVDCPPLTQQGKTSTDIYLVMAMLDALAELPHLDEFVLLSADADFTPVLLRLRAHDKRTAALAIGPASSAYTSAADVVYTEETFIEDALGLEHEGPPAARLPDGPANGGTRADLLRRIAGRVYEEASATGAIEATALVPILKEVPAFTPSSNWLGYHSLRALSEAVARTRPDLAVTTGDAWQVLVVEPGEGAAEPPDDHDLRDRIVACVAELVAGAEEPVVLASAAHTVIQALGPAVTETKWAGAGTFRALLEIERAHHGLHVATGAGSPGFVFDPDRHAPPQLDAPRERLGGLRPELADFVRRIHAVTQVPELTPEQFAAAFDAIAEALDDQPYHLTETSKRARDLAIEYGFTVPRSAIGFALKGLHYRGFDFAADLDGLDVAEAFRDNVRYLAEDAHMELDGRQLAFLDDWLLGGFEEDEEGAGGRGAGTGQAETPEADDFDGDIEGESLEEDIATD